MANLRRTDAKAFFANERTFLHWMTQSVTIGSISAALLGISGHAHKNWGSDFTNRAIAVRCIALVLMLLSIVMACYAAYNFRHRSYMLEHKLDGPYDSKILPFTLGIIMIISLLVIFSGAVAELLGRA